MNCPHCGYAGNTPDNTFCEQCGNDLAAAPTADAEVSAAAPAVTPQPAATGTGKGDGSLGFQPNAAPKVVPPEPWEGMFPTTHGSGAIPPQGNCTCGAGPDKVDADGICNGCGVVRSVKKRDHFSLALSADIALTSDLGRSHWRNEDYGVVVTDTIGGAPVTVFIVCDGVSSSESPDDASETACRTACRFLLKELRAGNAQKDPEKTIKAAIMAAQAAVLTVPYQKGTKKDPPECTFVGGFIIAGTAHYGWAGDSRLYAVKRIADGTLAGELLTVDDSWINYVVDQGQMTLEQALVAPEAHSIIQSLGPIPEDGEELHPNYRCLELTDVVYLIDCSDGFWNYAHPNQDEAPSKVADLVQAPGDAIVLADSLVAFANNEGGHDNITVIVIRLNSTTKENPK